MARISGGVGYLRRTTCISAFAIRVSSGSCISTLYPDSDLSTLNAVKPTWQSTTRTGQPSSIFETKEHGLPNKHFPGSTHARGIAYDICRHS